MSSALLPNNGRK